MEKFDDDYESGLSNHSQVNRLVETILELYSPEKGFKFGYAYPLKDSKEDYIWEIEKLYELSEEELKELMRKLQYEAD